MRLAAFIVSFIGALMAGMTFIDTPVEFLAAVLLFSAVATLIIYPADRARAQDDAYNVRRRIEAERAMREVHIAPKSRYDVFHHGQAD